MPTLGLREESCALPDVTLVRVSGTFDVATLPQFEDLLKRLRQAGRVKIVVDLAGLDYISSSGLGAFIGTVDPFRAEGGDLVFVNLGERIQKIFKVVGFMRLLTVLADESEALKHFQVKPVEHQQFILAPDSGSPHSGEAFDVEVLAADARGLAFTAFSGEALLRASTGIVSPAKIGPFKDGVWRGKIVLTGPGSTGLRAVSPKDSAIFGEIFLQVRETKPPASLPFTVACPGCGLSIQISAFNVYRCHACDEIYFVDKWAHAVSLKAGRRGEAEPPRSVNLAFPADVNLLAAVRAFMVAVLKEHGYGQDLINDLEMAADEAVTNVVEHAYLYDNRKTVILELSLEKTGVQAKIKDQGQAFNPLEAEPVNLDVHVAQRRTGGLGVHLMQSLMDSVDYRREDTFNVLTLTKRGTPE